MVPSGVTVMPPAKAIVPEQLAIVMLERGAMVPSPAIVVMVPSVAILRMRPLPESARYTFPAVSVARCPETARKSLLAGLISADVAGPPSPE